MEQNILVLGRYRLLDRIGRGGMGEVWAAEDEYLGRRVAVKLLRPDSGSGGGPPELLRERFRREARLAAGLQHPGITVIHDFGEWDGILFLVMELLEGADLGRLLEGPPPGPLPVPEVVAAAEQIAAALAYTHARGVIHRDLKPGNLIRTPDGAVKICDFGIARLGSDLGVTSRHHGGGFPVGTPAYMSPEQIDGSGVDERSDLYSFGCVLYELLVGHPPFHQGDPLVILLQHRDDPPLPPRRLRPEIPEELQRLVLHLLAKDPDARPSGAEEVAHRLRAMPGAGGPAPLPDWARAMGPVPVSLIRVRGDLPAVAQLTRRWT